LTGLAIAIFACSALAGCAKSDVKNAAPTAQNKPGTVDLQDFGGETIRILDQDISAKTALEAYVKKGYEGSKMTERINKIQTDYNCVLEYVGNGTTDSLAKLQTSILISDPIADVAKVGYEHVAQNVEKGGMYTVLNDYADIIELDNADRWDQTVTKRLNTIGGYTFAVQPATRGAELVNQCSVMFFNKSLLEREGIWEKNNLYKLQKEKKWTWEKLSEIGSKVTKDTNGDGKNDQFGLIYNPHFYIGFSASNSPDRTQAGFFAVNENNEPVFLGRNKPQLAVLNYMTANGAKGKGWLDGTNYGQQTFEGPRKMFSDGKAAFIVELGAEMATFKNLKMQDTLGVVAVPIGPDNTQNEYYIGREWYQPWVIPNGVKSVERSAHILREFCSPLFSKEEVEIATESMLSDYIGSEEGILETYLMLGEPEKVSNCMESPFIATWWASIASYHGSFYALMENGLTGEQLNTTWGDAVQNDLNKYWGMVMKGHANIKSQREAAGKK
jgi:multiple sugar transport system substrate-binding protein